MRDLEIEVDTVTVLIALWRSRALVITSFGVSEAIHWRTYRLTHINVQYASDPKALPFDWVEGGEIRRLKNKAETMYLTEADRAHGIRGQHET